MSKAAELAALIGSGQAQGNKNFIINGDMQVWQRATAATAGANNTLNTVDRWGWLLSNDGAVTSEQSTDTPTGTGYSFLAKCTTADSSIAAGQYAVIYQNIEAQNLQPLQYGTSSAKTITLSFWAKSNKTGTYTVALYKGGNTGYIIPNEYTISSANTWEKKTITITPTAGSTSFITAAAAAFLNNNTLGFQLAFNLAFGSNGNGTNATWSSNTAHYSTSNQVNWMDSTSNNFYLSQVQLEIGEVATPFEHRSFGDELAKCQRYLQKIDLLTSNGGIGNSWFYANVNFLTTMRAAPTLSNTSAYGLDTGNASMTQGGSSVTGLRIASAHPTQASIYGMNSDLWQTLQGRLQFDAEL